MNDFQKAELVSTFVKATMNTFWELSGCELEPMKPEIRTGHGFNHDYSVLIKMSADQQGVIHINFPLETAQNIVKTLDPVYSQYPDDVLKKHLIQLGKNIWQQAFEDITYQSAFLTPRVLHASEFYTTNPQAFLSLTVPFQSLYGNFELTFCLQVTSQESAAQPQSKKDE